TPWPQRRIGLVGVATSSRAMRPPGRTTRASSSHSGARSTRLRSAKPQVTPSTVPSRTGRRRASPCTRGAVVRAAASIPKDRSTPIGTSADACSSRQRSPVPHARSSTVEPGRKVSDRTVSRRQRTSGRNVMMRLTRSYRGAMASNMLRTAVAFSSPWGSESGIVKRAIPGHRTGGWRRLRNPDTAEWMTGAGPGAPTLRCVARAHFRLFGIPIRVEPFFFIVVALFGIRLEPLWLVFAFVAMAFVSVLVHELGHALTYRLLGQRSAIVLHGFGGFTVPAGGGRQVLSKPKSVLVSLSGAIHPDLALGVPAHLGIA